METGIAHLLEASIKLECNLEITARSLVLYHHFRRCTAEIRYDESMVAAVAIHLSGRIHEQVIDMDSLICVFYSIVNQTTEVLNSDDLAYGLIKQTLIHIDFMMQRILEFNLTHRLAHQYLVPYLVMIFERSKNIADFRKELSSTCLRFICDFYTQQVCLQYQPELIAIACIDLGLYIHGLINDLAMITAWYMGFVCDITPDKVDEIKKIIMNLYEKPILVSKPIVPQPIITLQIENRDVIKRKAGDCKNKKCRCSRSRKRMPVSSRKRERYSFVDRRFGRSY